MPAPKFSLIGRGVYSLPEAARLTKIPPQRIRRWMKGYAFRSGNLNKAPSCSPAIAKGGPTASCSISAQPSLS
jgi:hypothetical protein